MTMLNEIEEVRSELGETKAKRLRQLREYSKALVNMSLHRGDEGKKSMTECLSEINEILAEAGLVSNR